MKVLIQRVKKSRVIVEGKVVGEIDKGILALVGIGKGDTREDIERLSEKLANLRIFEDENGKMNLNIKQVNGKVLSVPQFTLYADLRKGNRPGFDFSAPPDIARDYWDQFNKFLERQGLEVQKGVFGSHMEVELINDGPVTINLDSSD